MIREASIKAQVIRFRSLRRNEAERPWDDVAPELVRTLWRMAEDEDHAERIVDALVEQGWCPTPADIVEAAEQTAAARTPAELHGPLPNCPDCTGTGWKQITRGGLTGVTECPCDTRRAAAIAARAAEDARKTSVDEARRKKKGQGAERRGDGLQRIHTRHGGI